MKVIYLAGGCFWGTEKYFYLIPGVTATNVGYANGPTVNPSYEEVCHNAGHAETVRVEYDPQKLSLSSLLELFYDVIDPTSVNRQRGDAGIQYRTGIYYVEDTDKDVIDRSLANLQQRLDKPVAVESGPLVNYYPAEAYHQGYLEKNPGGYCHISQEKFSKARNAKE